MKQKIKAIFESKFNKDFVQNLLDHYDGVISAFFNEDWEKCLLKSGKFIEAVMKCLHQFRTGEIKTKVDVGTEIDKLITSDKNKFDSTIRIFIPRACRFVYNIASDRGGRHDIVNFNPNYMDAMCVTYMVSWIMAEFIRCFHNTIITVDQAQNIADSLLERKFSIVEKVGKLTFIHKKNISAREVILVTLFLKGKNGVGRNEVIQAVEIHGHTRRNAQTSLSQLSHERLIFEDDNQIVKILNPGIKKAEEILRKAQL